MTDKITLNNVVTFQNDTTAVNTVNGNSTTIVTAFDNTLSRDGTAPNQMGANLDMNNNQIINLPAPITTGSPLRLADATTLNGGGTVVVPGNIVAGTNITVSGTNPTTVSTVVSPTFTAPVLGTPASGVLTNCTGTAAGLTAGSASTVTTNANLTGPITSSGNATAIASQTGTGTQFVMSASPTITGVLKTPSININNSTVSAPFVARPNTNENLFMQDLGSGIMGMQMVNDANNAFTPLHINASPISLNADNTGSGVNIQGWNNASSAASGVVGEYVSADLLTGSAIGLTTSSAANVTSISLTAGDWDVWGTVCFKTAATTTLQYILGATTTTSAAVPIPSGGGLSTQTFLSSFVPTAINDPEFAIAIPTFRFNAGSTVTVFLVALAVFGVSTVSAYGSIRARRVR